MKGRVKPHVFQSVAFVAAVILLNGNMVTLINSMKTSGKIVLQKKLPLSIIGGHGFELWRDYESKIEKHQFSILMNF